MFERLPSYGFADPLSKDWANVSIAKRVVSKARPGTYVKIECFNKADADEYREKFTAEELEHIVFSWLTWPTKFGANNAP